MIFVFFVLYLFALFVFRAIASSAPIWQFTGMTPCNDFYKVTSSVYRKTSDECALSISASWKAIDNVTSTSETIFKIDLKAVLNNIPFEIVLQFIWTFFFFYYGIGNCGGIAVALQPPVYLNYVDVN